MNVFSRLMEKRKSGKKYNLDRDNMPEHIAIIMDGNGRWAKKRKMPRSYGHRAGADRIKDILEECGDLGVKHLTIYAFSTENWKRPKDEVDAIMQLLVEYLESRLEEFASKNARIRILGDTSQLPESCRESIKSAVELTKNNTAISLNIALNYGGRAEITNAVQEIAKDIEAGKLKPSDITEKSIETHLYTAGVPDPELVIRTSGEKRLSNFLLWQVAYSEFWFTNVLWPDFSPSELQRAIYEYQNRDRRFGGVKK